MDIFNKIDKMMQADLGQFASVGHGYFTFPKLEGEVAPRMKYRGKEVLTWSLNNYLGLCNRPEVREVDAQAAKDYGLGYPMGSRMLTGNTEMHERFEREVSEFMGKEDAFLLNFGYQGIISIIQALVDRRDVIVYDQLSHACIMDGMMMTPAKRFVYRHNDMEQFEDRLKKAQRIVEKTGGGILVITEGVFGMKGDLGALDKIVAFKENYNFRLMVDDAHGFGVMGDKGIGTGEFLGVNDEIDVLFCTFAKSMASIGAFVCGDHRLIHYLRYNLRSQIYAKSLPMPLTIGALKRLELLKNAPDMRKRLWDVVNTLQSGLRERNFDIGITQSPVTPVYLKGGTDEAARLIIDLRENYHIFVSVVTYPVVEKGELMLRLIPTAAHTIEDVNETLDAFEEVRTKMEAGYYKEGSPIAMNLG
ncbi:MAG TPA: pyridoxal phosphate-dependent aminotransferase family protein [Bacteroidetes bacterium]|nr:pyridoxal phosphate-dependent aminotransferase family protein [Bacteroidota bacterium]